MVLKVAFLYFQAFDFPKITHFALNMSCIVLLEALYLVVLAFFILFQAFDLVVETFIRVCKNVVFFFCLGELDSKGFDFCIELRSFLNKIYDALASRHTPYQVFNAAYHRPRIETTSLRGNF